MSRYCAALFAMAVLAGLPAASAVCAASCLSTAAEPPAASCSSGHAPSDHPTPPDARVEAPAAPRATLAGAPAPCCAHETASVVGSVAASRPEVPSTFVALAAMDAFAMARGAAPAVPASLPRPPHPRSVPGAPLVLRI